MLNSLLNAGQCIRLLLVQKQTPKSRFDGSISQVKQSLN